MKPTPIELEMPMGKDINGVEHREPYKAYDIDEVDSILAEKDKEIARLKADYSAKVEELCIEKTNVDTLEQAWKQSKRALWLARAKRAIEKIAWFKLWNASISTMNPEDGARQEFDKWKKALGKFLAKTEECK